MASLREEYTKHKSVKDKVILEAGIAWVEENVLLLNESFNRESLQKLQGAISKFNMIFNEFAQEVPEVKQSLEDAVELMNKITMGEKISKKNGRLKLTKDEKEAIKEPATFTVKYLSILYNNLSKFFNRDMPALLAFPLFARAKENPQTPLKDLAESDKMKKAILHALVPGPEISSILKRMYGSMELPSLNYELIADQLLNLNFENFSKLMKVDKVPLVATPVQTPSPASQETTGEVILTEDDMALLKEIGEINKDQIQSIINGITRIQGILRGIPELAATNQKMEKLRSETMASIMKGGALNEPKSQMLAASANAIYTYFDTIADLWTKIEKGLPADRMLNDAELNNLQAFLTRAQGGITARITNWFKSKIMPGLSPSEVAAEIVNVVRKGQENEQAPLKGVESLRNLFSRLKQLKLPPSISQTGEPIVPSSSDAGVTTGAGSSQSAAPTNPAAQATPAGQSQQSQATAQTQQPQTNQQGQQNDLAKNLAQQMGRIVNINGTNPEFVSQVEKLLSAGWKISPPGA